MIFITLIKKLFLLFDLTVTRAAAMNTHYCRSIHLLSWHKSRVSSLRMLQALTWISFQDRIKWCWRGQGEESDEGEETRGEKNWVTERPGEREGRERCRLASRWLPRLLVYSLVQPWRSVRPWNKPEILLVLESIKQRGYNCSSY